MTRFAPHSPINTIPRLLLALHRRKRSLLTTHWFQISCIFFFFSYLLLVPSPPRGSLF